MKAVRLLGKEQIEIQDIPVPKICEDEILVKVRAASICGTDVRMFKNGYKNISFENPLTLGHEFSGDIAQVGKLIKSYKVGQRVSVAPNIGCGTCDLCVSGEPHLCDACEAFGIQLDGGFAEYVRIPAKAVQQGNISVLSKEISYQEAALVEPLSCVYNGQKLMGIRPGDNVLIIGMGPIGVIHIMVAKLFGAGRIFINDLSEDRIQQAVSLISDVIPIYGDVCEGFKKYGQKGVDICVIAAPAPQAQAEALKYMNTNGRLLFFGGVPESKEIVPINTNLIHYKQLRIQGCTKQSVSEYRLCVKLVDEKRIPLNLVMSDSYQIEDFHLAMSCASNAVGLKHVIEFH